MEISAKTERMIQPASHSDSMGVWFVFLVVVFDWIVKIFVPKCEVHAPRRLAASPGRPLLSCTRSPAGDNWQLFMIIDLSDIH